MHASMNPLVAEYRSLRTQGPRSQPALDERKVEIVRALDEDANQDEVSGLLLDLLRDPAELESARVEAIEVVGLYIDESSSRWRELFQELLRIHGDATETEALRAGAQTYVSFIEQSLAD